MTHGDTQHTTSILGLHAGSKLVRSIIDNKIVLESIGDDESDLESLLAKTEEHTSEH